ncbi:MAG: FmdE family protein [Chloroflexota bacterium]
MNNQLDAVLRESEKHHRHLCPRQVLGARMGLLAGEILGVTLPQTGKRLVTLVETDGCFADGVSAATGCSLGHRTMRLIDVGRVAATFVDVQTERAIRIAPTASSRQAAIDLIVNPKSRWHAYLEAYQILPDYDLFIVEDIELSFSIAEVISRPGWRVTCEQCGEEIINEREVVHNGRTLCRVCAGDSYYAVLTPFGSLQATGD